jgi:hypothetical protein
MNTLLFNLQHKTNKQLKDNTINLIYHNWSLPYQIARYIPNITDECSICHHTPSSYQHSLFSCTITHKILNNIPYPLKITNHLPLKDSDLLLAKTPLTNIQANLQHIIITTIYTITHKHGMIKYLQTIANKTFLSLYHKLIKHQTITKPRKETNDNLLMLEVVVCWIGKKGKFDGGGRFDLPVGGVGGVMWGEKGDEFWCITFTVKFGTNNICEYLD